LPYCCGGGPCACQLIYSARRCPATRASSRCPAYLVVPILLRRRSRLSVVVVVVVVVVGWLSVLLWRSDIVSVCQTSPVFRHSRRAIVLLWRRISLRGRCTIAILRRRCAVATSTSTVISLARIVRHSDLRGMCGVEV
jgi:hypothetical protein